MTNEQPPICQLCGGPIEGEVYRWDNNDKLTMHRYFSQCRGGNGQIGFAGFMMRNHDYIFGDATEPVLRKAASS